jgi:threonine dehydratase
MDEREIPSLAEIHIAASHLHSISVPITPILINSSLNELTGKNIYLKCENFQRTGSFKSRGALNIILNAMKIDPNLKGFVTYSSGNHGIAVSYAASLVQRPCVVIVSNDILKNKIDAIEFYGAELIKYDSTSLSPIEICLQISKERDFFLIPTSDDPDIIAGNYSLRIHSEFLLID